jgi:hypothetical protein
MKGTYKWKVEMLGLVKRNITINGYGNTDKQPTN